MIQMIRNECWSFGICHLNHLQNDKCQMIYDYDKGLDKSFKWSNDQVISEHWNAVWQYCHRTGHGTLDVPERPGHISNF